MKFLFFGAGAIGTYIGGSLALAGHTVAFIELPGAATALRQRGLRLRIGAAIRELAHPTVYTTAQDALHDTGFDLMVFALKSYDTQAVVDSLLPLAGRLPPALCLQNGVENESALARAFGPGRVIAGTVTSAVGRVDVGEIRLERLRGMGVALGHPLSIPAVTAFREAGLRASPFPDPASMKWSKMLTNLLSNASSAILDMTPAEVYGHPALFRREREMLRECLRVMRAMHLRAIPLPGTPVRLLAYGIEHLPVRLAQPLLTSAVGGGRGGKMPSFYLDLQSGRGKTEVRWLNGAVVRFGEQAGVLTPVNRVLTDTLEGLAAGSIDRERYRQNPSALLARFSVSDFHF